MCLCGDSECPSCGFLQGTIDPAVYGNEPPEVQVNPSRLIYETLVSHPDGLSLTEVVDFVAEKVPEVTVATVGRLLCLMAIERWVEAVGSMYFAPGPNSWSTAEDG